MTNGRIKIPIKADGKQANLVVDSLDGLLERLDCKMFYYDEEDEDHS